MAHAIIEIGDKVRSFDFDRRDLVGGHACYVEGIVEGIVNFEGCPRYQIAVETRIWGGEPMNLADVASPVLPPVNGTPKSTGGVCDGVLKMTPSRVSDPVVFIAYEGPNSEAHLAAELMGLTVTFGSEDWFAAYPTGKDEPDTEHVFFRAGTVPPIEEFPKLGS